MKEKIFELQEAIWQNDSDEENGPVENAEVQTETTGVTEEKTDETEEMLASSKCQRRKCGYCGIYVRCSCNIIYKGSFTLSENERKSEFF